MPASAAPCLLPPTAIVYMPQRVSLSRDLHADRR